MSSTDAGRDLVEQLRVLPIQAIGPRAQTLTVQDGLKPQKGDRTGCRWAIAIAAIALIGGSCPLILLVVDEPPTVMTPNTPVNGLTIFAVFFVAALAIERLLEPLSNAILSKEEKKQEADTAKTKAGQAVLKFHTGQNPLAAINRNFSTSNLTIEQLKTALSSVDTEDTKTAAAVTAARNKLDGASSGDPTAAHAAAATALQEASKAVGIPTAADTNTKLQDAAKAAEALSVRELARTTIFWVIATILGMVAAATMKLYFLNTVGITKGAPWEEILATGLIIGAGTKPLHDLVQMMSAKQDS